MSPFGSGIPREFQVYEGCNVPGLPKILVQRYNYCIWGIDKKGNGALFGVSAKN